MLRNRSVRPVGECDHQALVQTSGSFVDSVAIDTDEFEFNSEHVDGYPKRGGGSAPGDLRQQGLRLAAIHLYHFVATRAQRGCRPSVAQTDTFRQFSLK